MPKTVPLINTGKTFTFKTHSCLEKLRLVANADNHKVPQFPKAQVYRLPIHVPGFPSETSIFPPKSFTPSSTLKVAQPSLLPPSITVKEKLNFPSSSSSSSSSQPALLLPSIYGERKAQLLILITIPLARTSTASAKSYRINRQHTNACTDTRQRRGHWKPPGNTDRQWQHCPRAINILHSLTSSRQNVFNHHPTKRSLPTSPNQPVFINTLTLYMHIHSTITNSGNTR